MTVVAINCIEDVVSKLDKIPSLRGRVFHVFSDDDLIERTKGLTFPCIGVVYDGLRAIPEGGKDTHKIGGSAEMVVSVIMFFRNDTKAKSDPKDGAVVMLDVVRDSLIKSKSPSGHFWKFQVEAPIEGKSGVLAYLQRWATPVQLV